MTAGINSLKNTLENLKKYIEHTFTKELVDKFCLDAAQLSDLATSIQENGLVNALSAFFSAANKEQLATKMGKSTADISDLIEKMNNMKVIEKFNALLEKVNSFADLLGLEAFLNQYGSKVPYAAVGCAVFSKLLPILFTYAVTRSGKDKAFMNYCKSRLDYIAAVSSQNMQFNAGNFLVNYSAKIKKHSIIKEDEERLSKLATQARNALDYTPALDMAALHQFAVEIFDNLYVSATHDYLLGVTSELSEENIVQICSANQKISRLNYDGKINYALIKKLYGECKVDRIMASIQEKLHREGGDDLYYDLRWVTQERSEYFALAIFQIYLAISHGTAQALEPSQSKLLNALCEAKETIRTALLSEQITDEGINVILNRALLGFCQDTAIYFKFPWNLKEEVIAGVSETVSSSIDMELSETFSKMLNFSQRPIKSITQLTTTTALVAVPLITIASKLSSP